MEKYYLIIASGIESKKTGTPYSICKLIVKLEKSEFLSDKDTKYVPEFFNVGTIIKINEEITI